MSASLALLVVHEARFWLTSRSLSAIRIANSEAVSTHGGRSVSSTDAAVSDTGSRGARAGRGADGSGSSGTAAASPYPQVASAVAAAAAAASKVVDSGQLHAPSGDGVNRFVDHSAYDFDNAVQEWSRPPADGSGYISTKQMFDYSEAQIRHVLDVSVDERFGTGDPNYNWRNNRCLWVSTMHAPERTKGKHILDFGCGMDTESLALARLGNTMSIADISIDNLNFVEKALAIYGFKIKHKILVQRSWPYLTVPNDDMIDIFCSNGVLHHTPQMPYILRRASEVLAPGGEVRVLLYNEIFWQKSSGVPAPAWDAPVVGAPGYDDFVRKADIVGQYADFYTEERLAWIARGYFAVKEYTYMTTWNIYSTAVLVPLSPPKDAPPRPNTPRPADVPDTRT